MSKWGRVVTAALIGGAALAAGAWYDGSVMVDAQRRAGNLFDPTQETLLLAVGSLAVAGAVLALGVAAWKARSVFIGVAYAVVGGFFTFLPVIVWEWAAQINGAAPVLPEPIASAVSQIYFHVQGPLNADGILGGAMLVMGLVVIGRQSFNRSRRRVSEAVGSPELAPGKPQPDRPASALPVD